MTDQPQPTYDPDVDSPDDAPGRDLALELVRVTEAGAIAAGRWVGRGDKEGADGVAVDAMRALIATVGMDGVVVIGEGEKDNAPMLYNGEHVGDGTGPKCDVAVDPVDGTTLTAKGMPNAVAVMAVAPRGSMYDPSAVFYMEKLVTGPEAADVVDIRLPVAENIRRTAKAKGSSKEDITVCVLDRPRHADLVDEIRATGARIKFIADGDVAGAIMAARPETGIDLMMGVGGTPEGIIAACAMKALGGVIQGRAVAGRATTRSSARSTPATTSTPCSSTDELVVGDDCFFVATGITDGELLRGVRYAHFGATTHSLVMRSRSGTIRTHHQRAPVLQDQQVVVAGLRAGLDVDAPPAPGAASHLRRLGRAGLYSPVTSRRRRSVAMQHSDLRATAALPSGIELSFDTFGDRDDPALLLIMGLSGPLNWWDPDLCSSSSPSGASTSSASTTATSAGRRGCAGRAVRRSDVVRGFRTPRGRAAVHPERHGRRRRRPARPPRHRARPTSPASRWAA